MQLSGAVRRRGYGVLKPRRVKAPDFPGSFGLGEKKLLLIAARRGKKRYDFLSSEGNAQSAGNGSIKTNWLGLLKALYKGPRADLFFVLFTFKESNRAEAIQGGTRKAFGKKREKKVKGKWRRKKKYQVWKEWNSCFTCALRYCGEKNALCNALFFCNEFLFYLLFFTYSILFLFLCLREMRGDCIRLVAKPPWQSLRVIIRVLWAKWRFERRVYMYCVKKLGCRRRPQHQQSLAHISRSKATKMQRQDPTHVLSKEILHIVVVSF